MDVLATTHVQASVVEGDTILSHLHKYSRSKEGVLIVDELSMISLAIFVHLAEGLFIGRKFCIVGDPFQFPPIGSNIARWSKLIRSDFLHDMWWASSHTEQVPSPPSHGRPARVPTRRLPVLQTSRGALPKERRV